MQSGSDVLKFMMPEWADCSPAHSMVAYLTFLPATTIDAFPAFESAVAEIFGLTCFGFLASLLPRLLLPLDIGFPF